MGATAMPSKCPHKFLIVAVLTPMCLISLLIALYGASQLAYTTQNNTHQFKSATTSSHPKQKGIVSSNVTRRVLILAYMRSGSTLTGSLFNENPDAFYMFEPLATLDLRLIPNKSPQISPEGEYLGNADGNRMADDYAKTLECIYTCDFRGCDVTLLNGRFTTMSNKLSKSSPYMRCVEHLPVNLCAHIVKEECLSAKIIAIKTIRFRLKDVTRLFKKFPDLKLIHLTRDPRGIVHSRKKVKDPNSIRNLTIGIKELCRAMESDLTALAELRNDQREDRRENVLPVSYEDLATSPVDIARNVYSFLGLKFPDVTKSWLIKSTRGSKDDHNYGTTRVNSVLTAYKWRDNIPMATVSMVDTSCAGVYSLLGYTPVRNVSQLRNKTCPLRTKQRGCDV